jgi:glutathione S-transferase
MGQITTIARLTQTDFKKVAKRTNVPQLITIPYSHFVELGRWSLQIKGKPFVENGYAPGQHVLPVVATRLGSGKYLSKSSYVERVQGRPLDEKKAANARSTAVPLLVLPDQRILTDSWEIATVEAGFEPLSDEDKTLYDRDLGPTARQWAYSYVLKHENKPCLDIMFTTNTGWLWRIIWWFVSSYLHKTLCKLFLPFNPQTNRECRDKLDAHFAQLDERVKNKKGKYLRGDTISLEDLALCSLGAVVVMPPLYAKGLYNKGFDMMAASDREFVRERDAYRNTATGQYILNFYAENRNLVLNK